jgi:Family of unknown function (DUF5318)
MVTSGPESLPRSALSRLPGQIEYRLARNAVVSEYQRGRLSRLDVCDAHPELLRAARSVGETTVETCPICEEDRLVHVSFAFGSRLPPGGRCLASAREEARLSRRSEPASCYVVEVCPSCSWNHLSRMYVLGGPTGTHAAP